MKSLYLLIVLTTPGNGQENTKHVYPDHYTLSQCQQQARSITKDKRHIALNVDGSPRLQYLSPQGTTVAFCQPLS